MLPLVNFPQTFLNRLSLCRRRHTERLLVLDAALHQNQVRWDAVSAQARLLGLDVQDQQQKTDHQPQGKQPQGKHSYADGHDHDHDPEYEYKYDADTDDHTQPRGPELAQVARDMKVLVWEMERLMDEVRWVRRLEGGVDLWEEVDDDDEYEDDDEV